MTAWLAKHPCLRNFLAGIVVGLAVLLLVAEQIRDKTGQGTASYYSQF